MQDDNYTSTTIEMSRGSRVKKSELHIVIAKAVLSHIRDSGEQLIVTPKGIWFYSEGIWELCSQTIWLEVRIHAAIEGLGFTSNMRLRNETREWILRQTYIWRKEELPWDQHGKIPVRNGLVDPLTGELEPARPDHFCSWRIDIDYDKAATCPWWETMVADVFGDRDRDERDALAGVVQECIGAALIDKKPRSLSKALVFWGNENRAKSGILDVVGGLFGSAISSSIGSLEGNHGLMPFRKRAPWILHEAFGGQWHFSSVVKAIVTQEPVLINIKNGPMLTRVVYAPIFWATNHQPQFKEPTKAIVSRMIVIEVTRQFDEANPIGAAAEAFKRKFSKPGEFIVATELPGVLNWALKGLQRALERGSIATTASIDETANLIHRDSNLVAGFLDECIEFDPNARLRIADFNLAHSAWWLELKGESRRLPSGEAVNKALKAAGEPRVALDRAELRDNVTRYYGGVRLNKAGLRYHRAAYDGRLFEGKKSPTATNPGAPGANVNDDMPASWDTRKSIIAMRKAFARVKSSDDRSR